MKEHPSGIQQKCVECEQEEKLQKNADADAISNSFASNELSNLLNSSAGSEGRLPQEVQSEMVSKWILILAGYPYTPIRWRYK